MSTQTKDPVLFDDEGNKADMRGLSRMGITFDSVFQPSRYTCGGCGGTVWAWTTSTTDPRATSVCRTCTGETGIVMALVGLDTERERLGLGPIDPLIVRAMLHDPSAPRADLPEIAASDCCWNCGERITAAFGVATSWMHAETREERCEDSDVLARPEATSVHWLPDEMDAARGLVEFPFDDRLAAEWTPSCELPECDRQRSSEERRAGVLFDGEEHHVALCDRHWAAWERIMCGEPEAGDPFEAVDGDPS